METIVYIYEALFLLRLTVLLLILFIINYLVRYSSLVLVQEAPNLGEERPSE